MANYARLDDLWKALDALGLCVFGFAPRGAMPLDTMLACFTAITGWENAALDELVASGRRASLMARAFNHREGFTVRNDRLPNRLFAPKPGRQSSPRPSSRRRCGPITNTWACDPETGRPLPEHLEAFGLGWVEALLAGTV